MFKDGMTVLAALGFTEKPEEVLGEAIKIARKYNGKVYAMHVIAEVPTLTFYDDARTLWEDFTATAEEEAREQINTYIKNVSDDFTNVESIIDVGDPSSRVISKSDELAVDLIVMGHHVRKGINHLVHLNSCEKVVRFAKRPVLSIFVSNVCD